jgi:hypothetical protein
LSGLDALQLTVEGSPDFTVVGFAEQEIVGGFFGGSFTVKLALQLALAAFLPALPLLTLPVTV